MCSASAASESSIQWRLCNLRLQAAAASHVPIPYPVPTRPRPPPHHSLKAMADDRWRAAAAAAVNLREKSEPVLLPPACVKPEPDPAQVPALPASPNNPAPPSPPLPVKREPARPPSPAPSPPAPSPLPAASAAAPPEVHVHVHVHAPALSGAYDLIAPPHPAPPDVVSSRPARPFAPPRSLAYARSGTQAHPQRPAARSSDDDDIPLAEVAHSLQQARRWRAHVGDIPSPPPSPPTRDVALNARGEMQTTAVATPARRPRPAEAAPRTVAPSQPDAAEKRVAATPAAKAVPRAGKAPRKPAAPERRTQSRAAPEPAVTAPPLWRPCAVELTARPSAPPRRTQTRLTPTSAAKTASPRRPRASAAPYPAHGGLSDGATLQFAALPRRKLPSKSASHADGVSQPPIQQHTRRAADAVQQHVASAVRPAPTPVRKPSPQRRARAEVESQSRMPARPQQPQRAVDGSSGRVQSEREPRPVKVVRMEGQAWRLPDPDDVVLPNERTQRHPTALPASWTASPQPVDGNLSNDEEYRPPARARSAPVHRKEEGHWKQKSKKNRAARRQAARDSASAFSSPASQSEAAVLRQVIRYGLLIIERSPSTGLPTWLACKLCAIMGCPGRRAGYIHVYRPPLREFLMLRHSREHTDVWPQYQRSDDAAKIAFFKGKTLPEVHVFKNLVEFLKSIWGMHTTPDDEVDVRKPALTGKENTTQNAGGSAQSSEAEPGENAKRRRHVDPMYQHGPVGGAYGTEMARRDMLSGQKRKAPVRARDEHERVMKKRL